MEIISGLQTQLARLDCVEQERLMRYIRKQKRLQSPLPHIISNKHYTMLVDFAKQSNIDSTHYDITDDYGTYDNSFEACKALLLGCIDNDFSEAVKCWINCDECQEEYPDLYDWLRQECIHFDYGNDTAADTIGEFIDFIQKHYFKY